MASKGTDIELLNGGDKTLAVENCGDKLKFGQKSKSIIPFLGRKVE